MTMALVMHAAGVACLVLMAGAAAWTIYATIAPARHKMLAALRGQPASPAASVEPHSTAHSPQLRRVEAAAEPTIQAEA